MFFFQIKCAPFFLGIAEWVTVITRTIYVCLRKLCLLATECKIWALRNLLGIHKAPLKLVILELGCCFTAPVSITFTHSVISTTVIATLAAGNVIQLDLMAAALTLAGPLAVLQLFDELAKRDLLEKVKSGWDTLQVFSLFSFSLYTLHIHKGLLLCFQKKSEIFWHILFLYHCSSYPWLDFLQISMKVTAFFPTIHTTHMTFWIPTWAFSRGITCPVCWGSFWLLSFWGNLGDVVNLAPSLIACEKTCAQMLSRKLVHILAGLVFMLPWPLFRWEVSPLQMFFAFFDPMNNWMIILSLPTSFSSPVTTSFSSSRSEISWISLLQFFCIILMHNCNVGGTTWMALFCFFGGVMVGSSLRYHTNH